jgi:hypothetical protein
VSIASTARRYRQREAAVTGIIAPIQAPCIGPDPVGVLVLAVLPRGQSFASPALRPIESLTPSNSRHELIALANVRYRGSQKTATGVRRAKAALSSGCESHPANAPAGSNRSSCGGNETAEASGVTGHEGDPASVQAVTRVNAEQASKRSMRRLTRSPFRGKLIRREEQSEAVPLVAAPG